MCEVDMLLSQLWVDTFLLRQRFVSYVLLSCIAEMMHIGLNKILQYENVLL